LNRVSKNDLNEIKKQGVDGNKEVLHNLVSLLLTNTTLRSKNKILRVSLSRKELRRSLTINSQ
jgi:hypothetical protein